MWRSGRTLWLALASLACAAATGLAACGSEDEGPPDSTPGSVLPIGELAGPTIPLDESGFDPLLALTVEASGEGRTLIAGELKLSRPQGSGAGAPEVRIAIDGKQAREAEARQVGDDRLVIACGCELEPGEHEVELQGRAVGGVAPVAARSLVALDGVEYETETPTGTGPLPPAINGSALETDPALVSGAPASLAQLDLADGSASSQKLLVIAQVGSTRSAVDPRGIALQAGIGGEEAARIASLNAASSKIDVFTLETTPTAGEPVDLIGNIVGGGSTELDLRYVVSCPCGLETES
jgi:hypothetical protein